MNCAEQLRSGDAEQVSVLTIDTFGEPTGRSPAQRSVHAGAGKANSCVQPSVFDMLVGANPASAMDGWAAAATV